jgi:exodeoxyribonuclease V alpha subunit
MQKALTAPIAIFTGGPGTGKTYSAARLIDLLQKIHGTGVVAVCAPTGKAAVRITEAMQNYGIDLRARTIHSLLGVASRSEGDGWGFQHDENNPLPFRFVVVDEASMIDVDLFAALCRACGPSTHLLLVGDTGQLPPVGHGAPLRDLIAAGVPCGELTEVRRNSGQIVKACHQIRQGHMFEASRELRPELGDNLKFLPASSSSAALDRIVQAIRAIARKRLADPVWECQVIVAVNDRSELSRKAVNQRLQHELNPAGQQADGNPFRCGDKIVCLKNGFYPVLQDAPPSFNEGAMEGRVFVANGEQGCVKHVETTLTVVQLSAPSRLVKVPRGGQQTDNNGGDTEESAAGCQWDLAYGISCHKSQGSEWKVVLVALDEYAGARMVCSRSWIYTAMSRAKLACLLVGKEQTAYGMIQRDAIQRRKTFLKELIQCHSG